MEKFEGETSNSTNNRVRLTDSWFAKSELYDSCNEGPIVITNNSNDELSFGGGGTNGAIVDYFFPDRSTILCGLMKAGRQHRDNWHIYGGPLENASLLLGDDKGNEKKVDLVPHAPGSIWVSSLPIERRQSTRVSHIIHVVGPINNLEFANGEDVKTARERASRIVSAATKQILILADTKLGAGTCILSGISAGIFARGSKEWTSAMYNSMNSAIREYTVEYSSSVMEIVLVGAWKEYIHSEKQQTH